MSKIDFPEGLTEEEKQQLKEMFTQNMADRRNINLPKDQEYNA